MPVEWSKKLSFPVLTNDGCLLDTLKDAAAYASSKSGIHSWDFAKRQLTRAALSDDEEDMNAAVGAFQNAVLLESLGGITKQPTGRQAARFPRAA